MSYKRKPLKSNKPPYNDIEYKPAPRAVVAGKNIDPSDDAKTTPKPIANGPPMYMKRSLGAQAATVDKPPTIPAVYLSKLKDTLNTYSFQKSSMTFLRKFVSFV